MNDPTRDRELDIPDEPWMSHGFISKIASQVSLPYRRPKTKEITRRNGTLTVTFSAGGVDCLPYGKYPRLFEAWACTMVKTNNPCFDPNTNTLELGRSFRDFLELLEVKVGGTSFRNIKPQFERLFRCTYSIVNLTESKSSGVNFVVAEEFNIDWLNPQLPPQRGKTAYNWVRLSRGYVEMLRDRPVPIDLSIMAKLGKPMAIDIYAWITRRFYSLSEVTHIKWEQLYQQFGSGTKELRKFKQTFKEALEEVIAVYPCRVVCGRTYVSVWPNITSIPTSEETQQINRERAKTLQVAHSSEQRQRARAKATESARAGKWFSLFGQPDQIWWCSEAWDINKAQNHLYGTVEQEACPVCGYDERNRARHASWA